MIDPPPVPSRHGFSGACGGAHTPPRNDLHPPEAFGTAPKSFGTPANYIYFDLIVSYLIILTTKFVKLTILWSQISPCRPRKHILLNFFLGLSGRPSQSKQQHPPRYLSPPERKYGNPSLVPSSVFFSNKQWAGGGGGGGGGT
jgi:hypothetical protein